MFKIPRVPKLPIKRAVSLASWAFVLGTGLTGIYNFASATVQQRNQAIVMKAAETCETKLVYKSLPCTLDEQKALLTREGFERQKWKGGVQAGIGVVLMMAAF